MFQNFAVNWISFYHKRVLELFRFSVSIGIFHRYILQEQTIAVLFKELLKTLLLENISEADGLLVDDDTIYTLSYLERHNNILSAIILPLTQ